MFGLVRGRAHDVSDGFVRYARGFMIRGLVGPNGSGKTALGVRLLIPSLEQGRRVLSTVRILDYRDPRPCDDPQCPGQYVGVRLVPCDKNDPTRHRAAHPLYTRWENWQQLLEAEKCDAFADEVTASFSSRSWQSVPDEVTLTANQFRKPDVTLTWTAPAWSRSDVVVRECTQLAVRCRGDQPTDNQDEDRWIGQNTRFIAGAYDIRDEAKPAEFDPEKVKMTKKTIWRGPGSLVFDAYDTNESVSLVAAPKSGPCLCCGLPKRRSYCECEDGDGTGAGRGGAARKRSEDGARGTLRPVAEIHPVGPRRALQ